MSDQFETDISAFARLMRISAVYLMFRKIMRSPIRRIKKV